ncbi:hypothetical protein [Bacteroides acidifaciens]|uniref:hypothetical protein n=1 Tax=Bacteroides acidifaciens TaxID=85831 RepID=UPI003F69175D
MDGGVFVQTSGFCEHFVVQNIDLIKEGIYKRDCFNGHVQVRIKEVIHQLILLKIQTVLRVKDNRISSLLQVTPIGYWLSNDVRKIFEHRVGANGNCAEAWQPLTMRGFCRLLSEIRHKKFKSFNYIFLTSGIRKQGDNSAKWYGNQAYVVDWSYDGEDIRKK